MISNVHFFQMQSGKKLICPDDDDIRKWLLGHLHIIQAKALAANLALPQIYKEKIQVFQFVLYSGIKKKK